MPLISSPSALLCSVMKSNTVLFCRNLLRNLDVFSEVSEEALVQLAGRLVPISVPPGHDHIREGDPVDSVFILEVIICYMKLIVEHAFSGGL